MSTAGTQETSAAHQSPERPTPPRKLAHVVLRTRDNFEALVDWYAKVLGAHEVFNNGGFGLLTYDDEHHRIAIARGPDLVARPHRSVGVDHIAFTYDKLETLLRNWERLTASGVTPFCCVNHGPTTSMYYQDPDGNRVELQVDNFDDVDEATALIKRVLSVNPIGVEFDPADLLERLKRGQSAEEITRLPEPPRPVTAELVNQLRSS